MISEYPIILKDEIRFVLFGPRRYTGTGVKQRGEYEIQDSCY